jgi:hypothetical protein
MAEIDNKNNKIRGFASLINAVLSPLNENKAFREKFKNRKARILLNVSNLNYAALIIVEHGFVKVKSVPNNPRSNLKKNFVGWNAFLELDTKTFFSLVMNRISMLAIFKKLLNRNIKIRGIIKLILLFKIFKFLIDYNK